MRIFIVPFVVAFAEWSTATAHDAGVTIDISGFIKPTCALNAPAKLDLGDLKQSASRSTNLVISCNSPFSYRLSSQNGGLKHNGGMQPRPGFLALVPYGAGFWQASAGLSLAACDSSGMKGQGCAGDRVLMATPKADTYRLDISWNSDELPFLAGTFEDTITITLSPNP